MADIELRKGRAREGEMEKIKRGLKRHLDDGGEIIRLWVIRALSNLRANAVPYRKQLVSKDHKRSSLVYRQSTAGRQRATENIRHSKEFGHTNNNRQAASSLSTTSKA